MENKFINLEYIAENIFKPIYPVIADEIIKITNIDEGVCLDIGSGTAALSRSLSKLTHLKIIAVDSSQDACKLSRHYVNLENLPIEVVTGRVENLPIKSSSIDLVVSRGSVFFWSNLNTAFSEIYRVLRAGGIAYVGGGFGNKELKKHIEQRMKIIKPSWHSEKSRRIAELNSHKVDEIMRALKIHSYCFINNDTGIWILIKKESTIKNDPTQF